MYLGRLVFPVSTKNFKHILPLLSTYMSLVPACCTSLPGDNQVNHPSRRSPAVQHGAMFRWLSRPPAALISALSLPDRRGGLRTRPCNLQITPSGCRAGRKDGRLTARVNTRGLCPRGPSIIAHLQTALLSPCFCWPPVYFSSRVDKGFD